MALSLPAAVERSRWAVLAPAVVAACAGTGTTVPVLPADDDAGGQTAIGPGGTPSTSADASGASNTDAAMAQASAEAQSGEPGGGAGCGGLALCDDFDDDTPGTAPASWAVVMGCDPNTQDTAAEGGELIVGVDSTEHHSGTNSVRIVGGDSCGYYVVNTSAFARLASSTQLYARFWVMFSDGPTQGHNGFLSMATTGGDHFRLGFQDSVVAWNAQTSDATLPDMDPQGTSLSVGTGMATWTSWNCMEFHIDESTGAIDFWFNGSAQTVAGLTDDGGDTQGVNDQWARGAPSPPVPTNLGLGWLGLNNQETVWFDDVALASTGRIGCN